METASDNTVILVAGPTASGKSGLAMHIAEAVDGVVINGDSMQVYDELRIVTARPDAEDEARVPHRLYGCMSARQACSVGDWLDMVAPVIEGTWRAGQVPIVTGGTGMYLKSLVEGIATIPSVPEAIRSSVQAYYDEIGGEAFRNQLATVDPAAAGRLRPADRQRLTRALEVHRASGRALSEWLADGNAPVLGDTRFVTVVLEPPREDLYERIDRRFEQMVNQGALEEVRAFLALGLDPSLPASKAVGVRELGGFLSGDWSQEQAVSMAQQASRNYAKRQMTWFRNQIRKDFSLNAQYSERENEKIFSFIRQIGLTPRN